MNLREPQCFYYLEIKIPAFKSRSQQKKRDLSNVIGYEKIKAKTDNAKEFNQQTKSRLYRLQLAIHPGLFENYPVLRCFTRWKDILPECTGKHLACLDQVQ